MRGELTAARAAHKLERDQLNSELRGLEREIGRLEATIDLLKEQSGSDKS